MSKRKTKKRFSSSKVRVGKTKRDRRDKQFTILLVASLLLFVFHFLFLEDKVLGHDIRYKVFVFGIPMTIGFIALAIFRWDFLRNVYKLPISIKNIIVSTIFLSFAGIVFSYIIFGNLASMAFVYCNRREAEKHMPQVIHCQVSSFNYTRRRGVHSTIGFIFKKDYELVAADDNYVKSYLNENPSDYELEIVTRKGIWDYYLVEDWTLKHK